MTPALETTSAKARRAAPAGGSGRGAPRTNDRLPCFIHITKNAGNTMRSVLRANYPAGRLFDAMVRGRRAMSGGPKTVDSGDPDVSRIIAELRFQQHAVSCVAVNLPFGIHHFVDRPMDYFALVREPLSRCLSQWYFLCAGAHDDGRSRQTLASFDFNVEQVLASPIGLMFSNDQVRLLSGSSAHDVGRAEFTRACDRIRHDFLLVGTVDRFNECLVALSRRLEWATVDYQLQNVGDRTDRSVLSEGAEQHFLSANEWDARLYEWVAQAYLPSRLDELAA